MSDDFLKAQEDLRKRLNESGEGPKRIAELHPDLKARWVGLFARRERPTSRPQNLTALKIALDRLDEIREYERGLVSHEDSSNAAV